jgi:adenylyltransferase/sulfurtransferase
MIGLNVLVVGAGALGNEVIKNLALLGVGRLTILDRDRIEASNLTRSVLFCTPDIQAHISRGTPKAALAARRAREINPDVDATAHVGEIADFGAGRVRQCDLVFSCLDNEMARLELGWMCTRLNKPLIDGGLGLVNTSSGMISIFPGAFGPCYACRKGTERRRALLVELQGREDPCGLKERLAREAAVVPTTPIMASVVGAMQVETGIRLALGGREAFSDSEGVSIRITLHPQTELETFTFLRSPNCPLHQAESVVAGVIERADRVSPEWTVGQMLSDVGTDAFLSFDWPMTARAACRACDHVWEPMLRRARFRHERCPRCSSADLAETEVLTGLHASSPWADRPLASLGLPAAHIHEVVVGSGSGATRRHIEVTGDLRAAREEVHL